MLHFYMSYYRSYLQDRFPYLQNQRGIEMLEWILIGGIVTGVAILVYTVLQGNLQGTMNTITNKINTTSQ
jgi:Flp pilus assembly pilin Flp